MQIIYKKYNRITPFGELAIFTVKVQQVVVKTIDCQFDSDLPHKK